MSKVLWLVACLLLVACESYTKQQGILTVPTGEVSPCPVWLAVVSVVAVVSLVVCIVLFLRGDQGDD